MSAQQVFTPSPSPAPIRPDIIGPSGVGVSPAFSEMGQMSVAPDPGNRGVAIDADDNEVKEAVSLVQKLQAPSIIQGTSSRRALTGLGKGNVRFASLLGGGGGEMPDYPSLFMNAGGDALCRGQKVSPAAPPQEWEKEMYNTYNYFLNYTFFPTVFWDQSTRTFLSLPFACFYSSHKPTDAAVGHPTTWVQLNLRLSGRQVWVDTACIADNNALLSLLASLETSGPMASSYIWFSVAWNDGYDAVPRRIGGASFGLSLAACVMGGASLFYTGFIKRIPPDIGKWKDKSFVKAFHTDDIVEDVKYIPVKVAYCLQHRYPIVIPHLSSFMSSIESIIKRHPAYEQLVVLGMKEFYTTTESDAGIAYIDRKQLILAGTTVPEACQLASIAWLGWRLPGTRAIKSSLYDVPEYVQGRYLQDPSGKLTSQHEQSIANSKARSKLIKEQGFTAAFDQAAERSIARANATSEKVARKRGDVLARATNKKTTAPQRAATAKAKKDAALAKLKEWRKSQPKAPSTGPRRAPTKRNLSAKADTVLTMFNNPHVSTSLTDVGRFQRRGESMATTVSAPGREYVSYAAPPFPPNEDEDDNDFAANFADFPASAAPPPPPLPRIEIPDPALKTTGLEQGKGTERRAEILESKRESTRQAKVAEKRGGPARRFTALKSGARDTVTDGAATSVLYEALNKGNIRRAGRDAASGDMAETLVRNLLDSRNQFKPGDFTETLMNPSTPFRRSIDDLLTVPLTIAIDPQLGGERQK